MNRVPGVGRLDVVCMAALLIAQALLPSRAQSQAATLTLQASAGTAGTFPTPTSTQYNAGASGSATGSWTLGVNCNLAGGNNECFITARLQSGTGISAARFTYTLANNTPTNNPPCSVASASPITLSTATTNIIRVKKNGTCNVIVTFTAVPNLTYTAAQYRSGATTNLLALENVVFGSAVAP